MTRLDPTEFPGAFAYEHTDIPADLTIAAWRRQRAARTARPRRPWRRLTDRLTHRHSRLRRPR